MNAPTFSLSALIDRFLVVSAVKYAPTTLASYREPLSDLHAFCVMRDLVDVRQVTRPVLEQYQRHLLHRRRQQGPRAGESLAAGTQRRRVTVIRSFFRFLVRQGVVDTNPAADLEMPKQEQKLYNKKGLSLEEIEHVLLQPIVHTDKGFRDRTMMEVLFATGIRRAELHALTVFDIDASKKTLFVSKGKGRKQRVVPISERALAFVDEYTKGPRIALLRRSEMETTAMWISDAGRPLSIDRLSAVVTEYVDAADLGRSGGCHLFRHTFATLLLDGGADIRHIQAMLGHENLQTTAGYTHVAIEKLVEVHERTHPRAQRPSTSTKAETASTEGA
jgi:integrase/recombinase XerD